MSEPKPHILMVDDDPVILRIYRDGLAQRGFKVSTAEDGLAAMKALVHAPPHLLVLDLMMPKFSGVDVLKFVRSQAALASLPVVVFSNAFMNDVAAEATNLGVQKALLKIRCSPARLAEIIGDVLAGRDTPDDPSQSLMPNRKASSEERMPAPQPPAPGLEAVQPAPLAPPAGTEEPPLTEAELQARARQDFLANGPETVGTLRTLCGFLAIADSDSDRSVRLFNLLRRVHFLAAAAGMADCPEISHLASAFEALLYELADKPDLINASVLRTCDQVVEVFPLLYQRAADSLPPLAVSARILAVDDDAICNRMVVRALLRARLQARSIENVQQVLPILKETKFDLILLDVEMPVMSGFDLCRMIRRLPGYATTPVVYVTGHADFTSRQESIASGGDDLIGKPILPLELAVKVLMHLLSAPR